MKQKFWGLTPGYMPKKIKNICLHRNLYMSVYSSIIHISKKSEMAQTALHWCMGKMWHTDIIEYYSARKRMKCWCMLYHGWILKYYGKWKPDIKATSCMILLLWKVQNRQKCLSVTRDWRKDGRGVILTYNWYRASFWGWNLLDLGSSDGCTTMCIY